MGTGIYVRRAKAGQSAYYAVSRAVNGEEDLSLWVPNANSLAASVAESAGTGMVLQYKQVVSAEWQFVNNVTRNYFVQWECPPNWNTPSFAAQLPGGRPADDRVVRGRSMSACTAGAADMDGWLRLVVRGRPRRPAGRDQPDPLRLVDRLPREQRHDQALDQRRRQRRRRVPQLQPEAHLVVRRTTSS